MNGLSKKKKQQLPFTIGDELPLRLDLGGARELWCCGDIGDFGSIICTLSGESGVLHGSLPKGKQFWINNSLPSYGVVYGTEVI